MPAQGSPISTRARSGFLASEPLLLIAFIILTLYFARELLVPVAFALVLNFLLAPAVLRLEKWLGRATAVVLVILIFFSAVGTLGFVVTRQLVHVAELLPDYRGNIQAKLNSLHTPIGGAAGHAITSLEEMTTELSTRTPAVTQEDHTLESSRSRRRGRIAAAPAGTTPTVQQPLPVQVIQPPISAARYAQELLGPVLKPLGVAGVVIIFTIYMLMNREDLRNRLLLLAGKGRLNLMTQALKDAATRISSYLVGQFIVCVCFGLLFGLGLFLIGVPDATLWGALAGILRYVPYVGTIAGGLMPVIFAVAVFPNWYPALFTLALFFVLEMATANFFEPWFYGSRTGVSALALLASAIFWSMLWGWAGLVLATPLTVCLIVMGRHVPQMSFLHILLGDEAELAPETKFYERLLAMDQTEAHAIADRFLEGRTLVSFYDDVVVPALGMAEQDRHKGGLDEAHSNFLILSTTELVAELTEHKEPVTPAVSSAAEAKLTMEPRRSPVVCIPASDPADELTATMLAQLLERAGHDTLLLPTSAVNPEILERLGQDSSTIVCVSTLPPFAFTQTRILCHRLREHLGDNRLLVGFWHSTQDPETTRERFGQIGPDRVVVRLSEALAQIEAWQVQPLSSPKTAAVPSPVI